LARIKKSAGKGGTAGRRQFEHFQGVSGLLSFMVVAKHYADIPDTGSSPIATLLDRGSLALHLFSALSGFSCFSSHPRLSVFSWRQVFGFYRSRLDRILLTMWFGYAVILLDDIKYKNFEKEWAHFWCEFTGHAYHVATLQDDQMLNNNCPNIPGWYVGSMIWMWLAFPLFAVMVRAVGKLRVWQFMGIVILVSFTWQLPGSLLYRFARWQVPDFNNHTMQMMYTASPLTFIASFILGILTASIAAEQADDRIEPYASKFSFFSEPHEERHIDDEHEPLLRPTFLDHEHDPKAWEASDDFMLGRALLVASVVHKGQRERDVYLPDNHGAGWWDWHTGAWHAGGQTITLPAPLERCPLLARGGSLVVRAAPSVDAADMAKPQARTLHLFPTPPGAAASSTSLTWVEDDGVSVDDAAGRLVIACDLQSSPTLLTLTVRATFYGSWRPAFTHVDVVAPAGDERRVRIEGEYLVQQGDKWQTFDCTATGPLLRFATESRHVGLL